MVLTITKSPKLKVHCTTLIVNYERMLLNFKDIQNFMALTKCNWITNEEILLTHDIMSPSKKLSDIINHVLIPNKLKMYSDIIIVNEQLLYGVGDRITELLNEEIPDLFDIDWLSSQITLEGNFVWFDNSRILKEEEKDEYWIKHLNDIQKNRGDFLEGRPIRIINDLGDKFQIQQEGVKNGCLYVNKDFIRHYFDKEINCN